MFMITPDTSDPVFLAWAGAWLDTEGFIGIRYADAGRWSRPGTKRFRLNVGITQVDPAPLTLLKTAFGGTLIKLTRPTTKSIHNLLWQGTAAARMLLLVHPYLVVKYERAAMALRANDLINARRTNTAPLSVEREDIDAEITAIKVALHELNGWSVERRKRSSEISARRGPLPIGRFSTNHDACRECGRRDGRHAGDGLCRNCYMRAYNKRYWATRHERTPPVRRGASPSRSGG